MDTIVYLITKKLTAGMMGYFLENINNLKKIKIKHV